MADFIDEKSPQAKGKRITTLEVAKIEDITPEPDPEPEEPEEPETDDPEMDNPEMDEESNEQEADNEQSIDVEGVPMTIEKPEDPQQLDLF